MMMMKRKRLGGGVVGDDKTGGVHPLFWRGTCRLGENDAMIQLFLMMMKMMVQSFVAEGDEFVVPLMTRKIM